MQYDDVRAQARVVDMMTTMHGVMADHYFTRARIVEISLLAASTVLAALTFLDTGLLSYVGIRPEDARILIGTSSISVFFISVTLLVVDWKGRAAQHREAFKALVALKTEWRELLASWSSHDDDSRINLARKSAMILEGLIPIPDAKFIALKARHYKKLELSRLISLHPGSSITLLRLRLWQQSNWKAIRGKHVQ
jgi:hypothetical protein